MAFLGNLENKLRPAATAGNTHDTDLVFFMKQGRQHLRRTRTV
jgi:hypothetical protein